MLSGAIEEIAEKLLAASFSLRAISIPSTQCCWVRLNKC